MNLQLRMLICLAVMVGISTGCSDPAEPIANDTGASAAAPSDIAQGSKPVNSATPASAQSATPNQKMGGMMKKMDFPSSKDMKFKDKVESNVELPKDISELTFVAKDGGSISLKDYFGKKHVVLVFTEGFNGMICPFCKTQTSRLIANYEEFTKRESEVIVVYPGPEEHLDEFLEAALVTEKRQVDKVPFPIVLDTDFSATNYFDIHSMHAHPSTYLIDKQGAVQFAYVGKDMTADRPSIKAILNKIDEVEKLIAKATDVDSQ